MRQWSRHWTLLSFSGEIGGYAPPTELPREIYLSPSDAAQKGADWYTIPSRRNVGLYGHVIPMAVSDIVDTQLAGELSAHFCTDASHPLPCDRTVYKIEYWRFFGHSHDFQVPIGYEGGIAGESEVSANRRPGVGITSHSRSPGAVRFSASRTFG